MAFMKIKNNPFEDYAKRWDGMGRKSERAIAEAATAAAETLVETIKERAQSRPR